MIVLDAGVMVELVANDLDPNWLGEQEWAASHLLDSAAHDISVRRHGAVRALPPVGGYRRRS